MASANENDIVSRRQKLPSQQNTYKFTQEEIRVIKECNKESFYQRCIPLSTLLGGVTYYAIKSGFFKPSPKLGASPKVIVSVVVGYFIGKFSYQNRCAEKLMQLPNSQIGEMLRQKRRGNVNESFDSFGPGLSLAPFGGVSSGDIYSDLNPNNSLDIDTSRPENPGLDENHRPSMDNPISEDEMPPVQKTSTSYEELRKLNRQEYQQKRVGNYREPAKPAQTPTAGYALETDVQHQPQPSLTPKNKYGDVWG